MVEGKEVGIRHVGSLIPPVSSSYLSLKTKVLIQCSYGNPSQLPPTLQKEYGPFSQHFVTSFAPEIFKVYLQQVDIFVSGRAWLSKKCQYQIFNFLTEWLVHPLSGKARVS